MIINALVIHNDQLLFGACCRMILVLIVSHRRPFIMPHAVCVIRPEVT